MKKQLVIALLVCTGFGVAYFATRESEVRVGMKELTMPRVDLHSVTKIVYSGKEQFELHKKGESFVLQISSPDGREVAASSEAVKEIFDAIAGLKGGVFVTEQSAKHPDFKVTDATGQKVTLYSNDKPVWSLIIGDYAEDGGRYIRNPSESAVYLSNGRFWDITRNSMTDFRERKVVGVAIENIDSIHLQRGQERHDLMRNAEIAKMVSNLRAVDFVDAPEVLKKAQAFLNASHEQIIVTPKKGLQPLIVRLAADKSAKKAYAQLESSEVVYEISDYVYSQLVL
jgi:hypothetical protein